MLLLSCGERPSQHRHGRLGSLQLGSRGRTEGRGGGAAGGAALLAADARALFCFGRTDLMTDETCFLGWLTGARGCSPTLLLVGAAGVLVGRRGDEEAMVFMFLSSLCVAGTRDLGPTKGAVRRLASKRRGFEG